MTINNPGGIEVAIREEKGNRQKAARQERLPDVTGEGRVRLLSSQVQSWFAAIDNRVVLPKRIQPHQHIEFFE